MNNVPIRIAVAGANGRMGRHLIQAVLQSEKTILGAALVRTGSELCGLDASKLIDISYSLDVPISSELLKIIDDFDILIDFTCPNASINHLISCYQYHKNIVIGTTGFSDTQKEVINSIAQEQKIGIILADNFSIGINLMLKLLEKIAQIIGDDTDIEIIEAHHRYKVDAPSSTALTMGKVIANILGYNFTCCSIYNRKGNIGARKLKSIGFATIRAGDIIGEHTVLFAKTGERLEITHKVSNRMTFAIGAVRAAIWLSKQKSGLFSMSDVLDLNKL